MDKLTVKIMSYSCKMADITEEGVSCTSLKDIFKDLIFDILLALYFNHGVIGFYAVNYRFSFCCSSRRSVQEKAAPNIHGCYILHSALQRKVLISVDNSSWMFWVPLTLDVFLLVIMLF